MRFPFWLLVASATLAFAATANAQTSKNGFDLSAASIPVEEIKHGGPPRDGIPAIDKPLFDTAETADWLADDDQVIGVAFNGIARAYPLRIMNWHEIVNDDYAGASLLVTFCPLCGTGIVFRPPAGDNESFGVSGLLYNSDVLLYDRATESLWSQIIGEAVAGPQLGSRLEAVPSLQTTWAAWRQRHPRTEVLSRETGFARDYDLDPYASYVTSPGLFFPVTGESGRFHPKQRVLGIVVGDVAKAYPFNLLEEDGRSEHADEVGGMQLSVHWDAAAGTAWLADAAGQQLAAVDGFWFAWYAFHPQTEVFEPQ